MSRSATLLSFDQVEYPHAWNLQHRLLAKREAEEIPDTLILLEHPPVFTVGRTGRPVHWGGDDQNLAGFPLYQVERGGSVTYHGPGQLVGYPILKLAEFCSGPRTYMSMLEDVLIRTLADWKIPAGRIPKLTGVWVGEEKIAAMGVRIIRGVTMHGLALNVDVDLAPFSRITPCGIAGCRVTSMAVLLGRPIDRAAVRSAVARHFADVFDLQWKEPIARPRLSEKAASRIA